MALKYKLFVTSTDSEEFEEVKPKGLDEANEYLNDLAKGPQEDHATASFEVDENVNISSAKDLIPDYVELQPDGTIIEDLRHNWKLSQSCSTCRYFQRHPYGVQDGANMTKVKEVTSVSVRSGWCTLRTGRSWISHRGFKEDEYIKIVTTSLGWKLTHVLMTCDEWKLVPRNAQRIINARVISRVPNYRVKLDGTVIPDPDAKFYHIVPSADHTGVSVIPVTPETRRLTPYQYRAQ